MTKTTKPSLSSVPETLLIPDLLPTLRPDLVVLLQENPFNTDVDDFMRSISGRVSDDWRVETEKMLHIPIQVGYWRSMIWYALGKSIYQWVQSFTELATALYAFSTSRSFETSPAIARGAKLFPALAGFFRSTRE